MVNITNKDVLDNLARIDLSHVGLEMDLDSSVSSLQFEEKNEKKQVKLIVQVPPASTRDQIKQLKERIEQSLLTLAPNVEPIVAFTSHAPIPSMSGSKKPAPREAMPKPESLQNVKYVIAVASGKGGVGKSTTAVNLAIALSFYLGYRVGVLDADIRGPNIQKLLGLRQEMELNEAGMMMPQEAHGISAVSAGMLVDDNTPMIWRGPMVHNAINNFVNGVAWGEKDIMIVDMPPETGDVPLSLAHTMPINGAIIVSTPQDLALIDARKGISMFNKLNIPVIGIVENMSSFCCPNCAHETPIFGKDGARKEAERQNIPYFGQVPLDIRIREHADNGVPVVIRHPDEGISLAYKNIAELLKKNVLDRSAPLQVAEPV
ncbi:MAG: ATP-binding protein [Proteobacteria bacterium]|jgi:ATP-binding protein involved in chromosome partitioning|nr:Mrp/NBP35 family ATP-binding protein [Alphaproteobacteria bacterium]NCC02561.1 ATP-binding protein [Pseudomonadota bacterium]